MGVKPERVESAHRLSLDFLPPPLRLDLTTSHLNQEDTKRLKLNPSRIADGKSLLQKVKEIAVLGPLWDKSEADLTMRPNPSGVCLNDDIAIGPGNVNLFSMPLRPINDTRHADGRFTSETAFRLNQSKAGLAAARYWKAWGFTNLERARQQRSLNTSRRCLRKMILELVEYGLVVINPRSREQVTPEMLERGAPMVIVLYTAAGVSDSREPCGRAAP